MKIYVMDAFAAKLFGGNQAGVALPEREVSDETMRLIAAELKHSETAFVRPRADGSVDLRYFTPAGEVELCGHATIAGFALLRRLGLLADRLSVNIELKNSRAAFPTLEEKTLEAVEKAGMREKTIYSSFNHYSLLKVRRLDPNAVCGLLYDAMLYQPWDYARQLGVQALHPHFSEPTFVTGEVEAAHRLGLSVNVWTVNEEADLRRMAEMNCDGIISNYPDVALRVLREVRG